MKYLIYILYVPLAVFVSTLWGVSMFFAVMIWHFKWFYSLESDKRPDFMPLDAVIISNTDVSDIIALNPFFNYNGFRQDRMWKTNYYFDTYYHYLLGICNYEQSW